MNISERLRQPGVIDGINQLIQRHGRFLCSCFLRYAALEADRKDLIPALNAIEELAEGQHTSIAVVDGRVMFTPDDDGIGRELKKGSYEKGGPYLTSLFVKPGMNCLDLGANVGYYTLLLSHLVGPSGKVIGFEPDPYNFGLLKKNMDLNGATNVLAYRLAVSNEAGSSKLWLAEDRNFGDHRTWFDKPRKQSVDCQTVLIDTAVPVGDFQFIKADIQGDELKAFLGAEKLLQRSPNMAILCELWPWGIKKAGAGPASALVDLFARCGFQLSLWSEKDNCGYRCSYDQLKGLMRDNESEERNLVEMVALKGDFLKYQS